MIETLEIAVELLSLPVGWYVNFGAEAVVLAAAVVAVVSPALDCTSDRDVKFSEDLDLSNVEVDGTSLLLAIFEEDSEVGSGTTRESGMKDVKTKVWAG